MTEFEFKKALLEATNWLEVATPRDKERKTLTKLKEEHVFNVFKKYKSKLHVPQQKLKPISTNVGQPNPNSNPNINQYQ